MGFYHPFGPSFPKSTTNESRSAESGPKGCAKPPDPSPAGRYDTALRADNGAQQGGS